MEAATKKQLQALAVRIRMAALEAIHSLGSGHLGGALSIADVLAALYPAFAERGWQPEVSLVEDVVIEADGEAVRRMLDAKPIVQQAFVGVRNVLGLSKKHDPAMLERACA